MEKEASEVVNFSCLFIKKFSIRSCSYSIKKRKIEKKMLLFIFGAKRKFNFSKFSSTEVKPRTYPSYDNVYLSKKKSADFTSAFFK